MDYQLLLAPDGDGELGLYGSVSRAGALTDLLSDEACAFIISATILEASHLVQGHIDATDALCTRPFLDGTSSVEEPAFFWRTHYPSFLPQRAVRQGDFKHLQDGQTQFYSICATTWESARIFWGGILIWSISCELRTQRGPQGCQSECQDWPRTCAG